MHFNCVLIVLIYTLIAFSSIHNNYTKIFLIFATCAICGTSSTFKTDILTETNENAL